MGSDRNDKKRALEWIETASNLWDDPLSIQEITSKLNANTQLMFGERVVNNLCNILLETGKMIETEKGVFWGKKKQQQKLREELAEKELEEYEKRTPV